MSTVGRASIDITTNQQATAASLQQMGSNIQAWGRRLARVMVPVFAAITGVQAFRAAAEQAEAIDRLTAAFERNGQEAGQATERAIEFANALQGRLGVAGGDTLTLMRQAVQEMGLAGDQLETVTQSAIGLANAYGMDTAAALRLLMRVQNDASFSLERYGITLDETAEGQERFNALVMRGIEGLKEMEDDAGTYAGAMRRMRAEWGSFVEEGLRPAVDLMTRLIGISSRLAATLNGVVMPAVRDFGSQFMATLQHINQATGQILTPLISAFTNFGETLATVGMVIRVTLTNAIDAVHRSILQLGIALDDLQRFMGGNGLLPDFVKNLMNARIDQLTRQMSERTRDALADFIKLREETSGTLDIPTIAAARGSAGGGGGVASDLTGTYRPEMLITAANMNLLKREDLMERQLRFMQQHLERLDDQNKLTDRLRVMLEETNRTIGQLRFGFQ